MTFDSGLIYKQVRRSRCMNFISDDFSNVLADLHENQLKKKITVSINDKRTTMTTESFVKHKFDEMLTSINPKFAGWALGIDLYVYNTNKKDGTNTTSKEFNVLCIIYSMWQYDMLETISEKFFDENMGLLKTDCHLFYEKLSDKLLLLNQGKLSGVFRGRTSYIRNTVESLISLDTKYMERLIHESLAGCELLDKIKEAKFPTFDF